MSVRIGDLHSRLAIEQAVRMDDGGGGADVAWETIAEVWAAVEAVSGGESVEADRVAGKALYRIVIRHRNGVVPAMRFRRGAEIFEIKAVLDRIGRGRFLVCECERRDL